MNRLVVVSNRVPASAQGTQAGGLAVALAGLMQRRGGMWFGWSGKASANRNVQSHLDGPVQIATIDLTTQELEGYYNQFSNSTLWPMLHSMPELMVYDRRSAQCYRQVNQKMTDALVPMLRPTDMLWIHDYHLMAMPAMLRTRGVTGPIGFFLHIPFPSADLLDSVPEAGALIRDLVAADLIGFQTANDVENFAEAARRLAGATRMAGGWLHVNGRRVRLGAFPVEIDAREFALTAESAWRAASSERLRRSLQGQKLVLGVDRLDPTKGLIQRLAGYRRLLETRPDWRRRVTLLQIAAESRQDVAAYKDLRESVDQEAGAINSAWSEPDWTPLRLVARAGARSTMAGYMREARVGLVTPLRDGMNLVAKEYIAAQDPQDPGVLILSQFAGAAKQLTSALLVNPHDADELADALDTALRMGLPKRQDRWLQGWRAIENATPAAWGRNFMATLLRVGSVAPANSSAPSSVPAQAGQDSSLQRTRA